MIRNWNTERVTETTRYRGGNTTNTTETLLFRLQPAGYL